MKRHLATTLALICMLSMAPAVWAATFKIATLAPDGTAWMTAMRAGADEIKDRTHGRVRFKFYPGGVMGDAKVVLRKMRIGQLQGGAVTIGDMSDIVPDMGLYGLPFLFQSLNQVDRVRQHLDPVLIKELSSKGYIGFGFAEGGFTYMMSDEPLDSVADVRGKKVWIPTDHEVGKAVFSAAGISPIQLPLSDVMTGLQTGLVDTVITSPIGVLALQWHTRVKFAIDEPLNYMAATLILSKRAFDRLKEEDQVIVHEVMERVYRGIDAQNRKDNISARAAMEKLGIRFVPLSPVSHKEWREVGERAMHALQQKSTYTKPVLEELLTLVNSAD